VIQRQYRSVFRSRITLQSQP